LRRKLRRDIPGFSLWQLPSFELQVQDMRFELNGLNS